MAYADCDVPDFGLVSFPLAARSYRRSEFADCPLASVYRPSSERFRQSVPYQGIERERKDTCVVGWFARSSSYCSGNLPSLGKNPTSRFDIQCGFLHCVDLSAFARDYDTFDG